MGQALLKKELVNRIKALRNLLFFKDNNFNIALIAGKVNQYYLTGTLQDGLLVIHKNGEIYFFVKKSVERAKEECPLDIIYPMSSYRDMIEIISKDLGDIYVETDIITIAILQRLKKYFNIGKINPLDQIILNLRAIKSSYEIELIKRSGKQHQQLMEEIIPNILYEGISEAEFHGELFASMIKLGYQGVSRFNMFQTEMILGQLGFGENSIFPTNFNGPGGMRGMSPSSPSFGSRERCLKKGDLVFVDIAYGIEGYHSDKTQVYSFAISQKEEVEKIHKACLEVQKRCAELLIAGVIPSQIYIQIMNNLPKELEKNFMGIGKGVRFLGHGVGLHVDELPVIAKGFEEPLAKNMVIALEPKCGIPGIGTVGVEDTYIVDINNAECVTGGGRNIIIL